MFYVNFNINYFWRIERQSRPDITKRIELFFRKRSWVIQTKIIYVLCIRPGFEPEFVAPQKSLMRINADIDPSFVGSALFQLSYGCIYLVPHPRFERGFQPYESWILPLYLMWHYVEPKPSVADLINFYLWWRTHNTRNLYFISFYKDICSQQNELYFEFYSSYSRFKLSKRLCTLFISFARWKFHGRI